MQTTGVILLLVGISLGVLSPVAALPAMVALTAGVALLLNGRTTWRWTAGFIVACLVVPTLIFIGLIATPAQVTDRPAAPRQAPSVSPEAIADLRRELTGSAQLKSTAATPGRKATDSEKGKWSGGFAGFSAMDDSQSVVYRLDAEDSIAGWLKRHRPTLVLRCMERKTEVYIETGMSAAVVYGNTDKARVRVRFDQSAPTSELWGESTDNEAIFAPSPIQFVRMVHKSNRLLVEFTPFNASPVFISFDLTGFGDDRLRRLSSTCEWS